MYLSTVCYGHKPATEWGYQWMQRIVEWRKVNTVYYSICHINTYNNNTVKAIAETVKTTVDSFEEIQIQAKKSLLLCSVFFLFSSRENRTGLQLTIISIIDSSKDYFPD